VEDVPYISIPRDHPAERYWDEWKGYTPCGATTECETWASPEAREAARQTTRGKIACPGCRKPYTAVEPLMSVLNGGKPGGYSRIGVPNTHTGQLAESIVHDKVVTDPKWRWGKLIFWQPGLEAHRGAGSGHPLTASPRTRTGSTGASRSSPPTTVTYPRSSSWARMRRSARTPMRQRSGPSIRPSTGRPRRSITSSASAWPSITCDPWPTYGSRQWSEARGRATTTR
jgi:hypothetical protein